MASSNRFEWSCHVCDAGGGVYMNTQVEAEDAARAHRVAAHGSGAYAEKCPTAPNCTDTRNHTSHPDGGDWWSVKCEDCENVVDTVCFLQVFDTVERAQIWAQYHNQAFHGAGSKRIIVPDSGSITSKKEIRAWVGAALVSASAVESTTVGDATASAAVGVGNGDFIDFLTSPSNNACHDMVTVADSATYIHPSPLLGHKRLMEISINISVALGLDPDAAAAVHKRLPDPLAATFITAIADKFKRPAKEILAMYMWWTISGHHEDDSEPTKTFTFALYRRIQNKMAYYWTLAADGKTVLLYFLPGAGLPPVFRIKGPGTDIAPVRNIYGVFFTEESDTHCSHVCKHGAFVSITLGEADMLTLVRGDIPYIERGSIVELEEDAPSAHSCFDCDACNAW